MVSWDVTHGLFPWWAMQNSFFEGGGVWVRGSFVACEVVGPAWRWGLVSF